MVFHSIDGRLVQDRYRHNDQFVRGMPEGLMFGSKGRFTLSNCQRPVSSLGVSHYKVARKQ